MARSQSWQELSPRQRAGIGMLGVIQVALLVAALRDLRQRSDEQINGSRRLWQAAVFVNYIGPLLYFWKGRRRSQA